MLIPIETHFKPYFNDQLCPIETHVKRIAISRAADTFLTQQ